MNCLRAAMLYQIVFSFLRVEVTAEVFKQCGGGHQQCPREYDSASLEPLVVGAAMLQTDTMHGTSNESQTVVTSSAMTCVLEEKVKRVVNFMIYSKHKLAKPTNRFHEIPQHTRYTTRAAVIRSVFHDAQDHNSLKLKSTATDTLASVDSAKYGEYGGVDGCLYIPYPNQNLGTFIHKWELNYGLDFITLYKSKDALVARTAAKFAIEACEILCCTDGHLTTEEKHVVCGPELSICNPKVPHPFPDYWHAQKQEPKWVHSMENMVKDKCVVDMHVLGSLIITEVAGGPKIKMTWGRRQADCNKLFAASKVHGEFKPFPMWLNAAPLGSFGNLDHVVKDFERLGFDEREMAALMGAHSYGKIHKYAGVFAPRSHHTGFCNSKRQDWGDGGYWDKTPDKLDNEYFKELDMSNPAETEACCGPMVKGIGCYTVGFPMQFVNGSYVPDQGCKRKWCMRSAQPWYPSHKDEADWAMITTQETMPQWDEHLYGKAPPVRRYMLAADWALLENSKTRAAVKEFALSEEAFHVAFSQAFDKATKLGYPSGSINTCSDPWPTVTKAFFHVGELCLGPCNGKAGFCDWCGSAGACCKAGEKSDPTECQLGMEWSKKGKHHCVKTVQRRSTNPPASATMKLSHHGEACWSHCNHKEGYCAWCGSAGACCNELKRAKPECNQALAFVRGTHFECVPVAGA